MLVWGFEPFGGFLGRVEDDSAGRCVDSRTQGVLGCRPGSDFHEVAWFPNACCVVFGFPMVEPNHVDHYAFPFKIWVRIFAVSPINLTPATINVVAGCSLPNLAISRESDT